MTWEARLNQMGFTPRDRQRIREHAKLVSPNHIPAAIPDLDAPWRVLLAPKGMGDRYNGTYLGSFNGLDVICWPRSTVYSKN